MIHWVENRISKTDYDDSLMDVKTIEKVQAFHKRFRQYSVTPLITLQNLAHEFGVGGIYVKDESYRFGLNSFKALGATYAIASYRKTQELLGDHTTNGAPGAFTFYACTDGNHGRAVAWAAKQMGIKAVIYMPKGCPQVRLEHIKALGAEAAITDMNYDDTIRFVADMAEKDPCGVIIQDTAWDGYTDIPGWIMQGYGVTALEAMRQLDEINVTPTHMIVQAGVGAFAGAAQGLAANYYGKRCPTTFVVEPHVADCHYRSAQKGDGSICMVTGDMDTIMAGLACGEPNVISWEILKNNASYFVTIDDSAAARGMRVLGAPLRGDSRVISGESGASGMGFLLELLTDHNLGELRELAGIHKDSHILVFSTEGDTDPDHYKKVIWDGLHSYHC